MNLDYSVLRTMVDSWGLLAMLIFFVGAAAFALRPSARQGHNDASLIPFRED